ncbi:MAG: glycosyltransferase family 39 protein [Sedimentisphaerales bacterium]|nr:glycosyltransferase family 39 protein [Sedimentisphaerales bacterium]
MRLSGQKKILLTLFAAAFALRVILVFTARGIATDGCSYLWLAADIAKGDFRSGINAFLPPLFPILSAGASFIFGNLELSGRMVSCLAGSLTVFPLFLLIKDIFNKKVAVVTVVLFIIHPYMLHASAEVLTEATYFFLTTSLAWLLWKALKNKKAILFLPIGLIIFLTALARPEGTTNILLVFGWIWLTNLSRIKKEFKWKLAASFFCLIVFILVLAPFYLHFQKETGRWKPTLRHIPVIDDKWEHESWLDTTVRVLKYKLGNNVPELFQDLPKAYYPPLLVLLLFGLIKRKSYRGFRAGEGFILSFILFRIFILTVFAGVTDRYFYAFIPIALCWASVGFWEINDRLLQKCKMRPFIIGKEKISRTSIIILLVVGVLCLPKGLMPIRTNRAIQKEVGCWLGENAGMKDFIVAANKHQEAFYAGAKSYILKPGNYEEIIKQIREANADFLILDDSMEKTCPEFMDMIKENDLEVFSTAFENRERGIIIYKVVK